MNEPSHKIALHANGEIKDKDVRIPIRMDSERIRIGCTEIHILAAKKIMTRWEEQFGGERREHIMQS